MSRIWGGHGTALEFPQERTQKLKKANQPPQKEPRPATRRPELRGMSFLKIAM